MNAEDAGAIAQWVVRERESRDMCFWGRMRECFHDDAEVNIISFQGEGA